MTNSTTEPESSLTPGLWKNNPVLVQLLGLCPSLAVTNSALNGVIMGVAVLFVLAGSSLFVSLLRGRVPKEIRLAVYILIIAVFVTVVDLLLQAYLPKAHKELGAFIALIVVNCIILGRQEAFASRNPVGASLADAVGMSVGFSVVLMVLGSVREVLGSGSWFGMKLLGASFEPWVIMILPPGGFFLMALMLAGIALLKRPRTVTVKPVEVGAVHGEVRAS